MRFKFPCLVVLASLSLPLTVAQAADSAGTITINPDGTVTDSDPMARHDAARAAVIKAEKINPPEPVSPKPIIMAEPEAQPEPEAKPEPKPVPVKAKPPVKKAAKPKPEESTPDLSAPEKPATPKAIKPKKPAKSAVEKKVDAEKAPKIKWNKPPKKKLKPVAVETAPVPQTAPPAPVHPLTRDEALRAAIQVAPPFRSSRVVPDQLNGHHIYRVILQTEDGQQDILVDGITGDILKE